MTRTPIGVGIVGASMERGWAKTAHVPALAALDEYEIRGVSARRRETVERSATELGVELAYTDHRSLVERPEIDLVVVTVKVPDHRAVVEDALAAGKMVYCEWPLGASVDEANAMAALAEQQGVPTLVGLQGGAAPAHRFVRELLAEGIIGRVLSSSLRAQVPGGQWTGQLRSWQEFTKDTRNGATMLTIPMGHALEPFTRALGQVAELSAICVRRRSTSITVEDAPAFTDAPDEIIVAATLDTGVVASLHYSGGTAVVGKDVVWTIVGEGGELVVTADQGYLHIDDLTITFGREDVEPQVLPVPERFHADAPHLSGPAGNVARLYRSFARHLDGVEEQAPPDFADAARRHRVLAAVERSSESGCRQDLSPASLTAR
jgi:predicted dehydrogenase